MRPATFGAASVRRIITPEGVYVHVLEHLTLGERMRLTEAEHRAFSLADGSHTVETLATLLARENRERPFRDGPPPRLEALRRLFIRLADKGMVMDAELESPSHRRRQASSALATGQLIPGPPLASPLPVSVVPGVRFDCDGSGSCCGQYELVTVEAEEAHRYQGSLPGAFPWPAPLPDLLPLARPGAPGGACNVAEWEGSCALLLGDGRCGVHAHLGLESKPLTCRHFPLYALRVGEEVRVSVRPECACVARSAERGPLLSQALQETPDPALTEGGMEVAPDPVSLSPGQREPLPDFMGRCDGWRESLQAGRDPLELLSQAAQELGWPLPAAPGLPPAARGHLGAMAAILEGERRLLSRTHHPRSPQRTAAHWAHDALERVLSLDTLPEEPHPLSPADAFAELNAIHSELFGLQPLLRAFAAAGLAHLATLVWLGRATARCKDIHRLDPRLHPLTTWFVLSRTLGLHAAQGFAALEF